MAKSVKTFVLKRKEICAVVKLILQTRRGLLFQTFIQESFLDDSAKGHPETVNTVVTSISITLHSLVAVYCRVSQGCSRSFSLTIRI